MELIRVSFYAYTKTSEEEEDEVKLQDKDVQIIKNILEDIDYVEKYNITETKVIIKTYRSDIDEFIADIKKELSGKVPIKKGKKYLKFKDAKPTLPDIEPKYIYSLRFSYPKNMNEEQVLDNSFDACVYSLSNAYDKHVSLSRPIIVDNELVINSVVATGRSIYQYITANMKTRGLIYIEPDFLTVTFSIFRIDFTVINDVTNHEKEKIDERIKHASNKSKMPVENIVYKEDGTVSVTIQNPKRLTHDKVKEFVNSIGYSREIYMLFYSLEI